MKNKFKCIGIAVLSAMIVFGLTVCTEPKPKGPKPEGASSAALLTGISFGDTAGDNVEVKIGEFIAEEDITPSSPFLETSRGVMVLQNASVITKPIMLEISSKATALVMRQQNANCPRDEQWEGNSVESGAAIPGMNAAQNNFIFVRVTAENLVTTNYYCIQVSILGGTSAITQLLVGSAAATLGSGTTTANPVWTDVTTRGAVALPSSFTTGTIAAGHSNTAINAGLKIRYGITVKDAAAPALNALSETPPENWQFADRDVIYISVTSQNGESTTLYIVEVEKGRNANLASVKLGAADVVNFGTGGLDAAALSGEEVGSVEPGEQSGTSFAITATASDTASTINWAAAATAPAANAYGTASSLVITDGQFLWIRVKAQAGNERFYKIEVILLKGGRVLYGSPVIRHATDPHYIDPLWNAADIEVYDVSRFNTAENVTSFMYQNPVDSAKSGHTTAWAKALWDDEGLYFYVNVDIWDYYADANAKAAGTVSTRTVTVGSDHTCDNVEMFTNERIQAHTAGFFGNQYRVGPPAVGTTGGAVSGECSTDAGEAADGDLINAFRDSNQYNSWIRVVDGKQVGYTVLARVPWTRKSLASANQVFDADGLVKVSGTEDGPTIGMEIQLNTSTSSGSRDAILTWNGITGQAYRNVASYGQVKLIMGNRTRIIAATQPSITTQPANNNYILSDIGEDQTSTITALSVTATAPTPPAANLSYQWYFVKTDPEGTGAAIPGATSASFKPTTAQTNEVGVYYFWVVVTNTRANGTPGYNTKTVTSNRALINVDAVQRPNITTQPVGGTFFVGQTIANRTVAHTAIPSANGEVTYQWWSANTSDGAGAEVNGATTASLTLTSTAASDTWYWVVITNTKDALTAVSTSNRARVQILSELVITTLPATRSYGYGTSHNGNTITLPASYQRAGFNMTALTAPSLNNTAFALVTATLPTTAIIESIEIKYTSDATVRFGARTGTDSGDPTSGILASGWNDLAAGTDQTLTLTVSNPATPITIGSVLMDSNPGPSVITIQSITFKTRTPAP